MGSSSRKTCAQGRFTPIYTRMHTYHCSAYDMSDCCCPIPFPPVVTGYCWSNLLSFVSVNTFDETVLDVAFVALFYRPLPHKDDALGLQFKVNKVLGEIITIIILFMSSIFITLSCFRT
jgi:hypothetical protein